MINLTKEIYNAFNKNAAHYESVAKIQIEIGRRLFARLGYLKIKPNYVLDLGCGPGIFCQLLKNYYKDAEIIGLDLSLPMLQQANNKQTDECQWSLVNGDMQALPFADHTFGLIFANQVLHWGESLPIILHELKRILHTDGCLMFTTLGPDTFQELKAAWQEVDHFAHTNTFLDLHIIGDHLLATEFADPVMDLEMLVAHYNSLPSLLKSLKAQGVRNINSKRNPGLTGKQAWQLFNNAYTPLANGKYPLTYEVVFGHAWKSADNNKQNQTETFIPVSMIKRI